MIGLYLLLNLSGAVGRRAGLVGERLAAGPDVVSARLRRRLGQQFDRSYVLRSASAARRLRRRRCRRRSSSPFCRQWRSCSPVAGQAAAAQSLRRPGSHRSRCSALVIAYELLYWTAGTLVYPYVADFYATRTILPAVMVAAVQIPRSLIFVGAVYPLLKSGLRGAPLVLALAYGVIGGVAPLLPDNPYMPADIRFYHAIETSLSNVIFGLVVGLLFTRGRPAAQA